MQQSIRKCEVTALNRPKKKCFSIEEDAILIYLVKNIGTNWRQISKQLPGRTERQCRERYKTYLDPNLRHDPWTPEEDQLLIKLYMELGPKWAEMSKSFPGRSDNSIKNRYNTHIIHRPRNTSQASRMKAISAKPFNILAQQQNPVVQMQVNQEQPRVAVAQAVEIKGTPEKAPQNDDSLQNMEEIFGDYLFPDDCEFRYTEYVL